MYLVRYGYSTNVAIWFGCVVFRHAANCFARCWYSGSSFIVQGIKYILFLLLCDGGCVLSMFGIGPGLVSMSPPRSIKSFMEWLCKMFDMLVELVLMLFLVRCFCLLIFFGGFGRLVLNVSLVLCVIMFLSIFCTSFKWYFDVIYVSNLFYIDFFFVWVLCIYILLVSLCGLCSVLSV